MSKKMVRSNKAQINYLCHYMAQDPAFAAGDFKTAQGAAQMERHWEALKAALDELGPNRSVEQWKTCWRDQKRKARTEGGASNKAINTTGNYVGVPSLSNNAALILGTIGQEMALGLGPAESPIGFTASTRAISTALPAYAPHSLAAGPSTLPAPTPAPPVPTPAPPVPTPAPPVPTPAPPAPIPTVTAHTAAPPASTPARPAPIPTTHTAAPPARTLAPPASSSNRPSRARKILPPDRFLNAQNENNKLLKDILKEFKIRNALKEREMQLKERQLKLLKMQNKILLKRKLLKNSINADHSYPKLNH